MICYIIGAVVALIILLAVVAALGCVARVWLGKKADPWEL